MNTDRLLAVTDPVLVMLSFDEFPAVVAVEFEAVALCAFWLRHCHQFEELLTLSTDMIWLLHCPAMSACIAHAALYGPGSSPKTVVNRLAAGRLCRIGQV